MLTMVEPYMILEEKLSTRFDNPASTSSHSIFLVGKKSHQRLDDPNRGMIGNYNKYTPLTVSRDKIF